MTAKKEKYAEESIKNWKQFRRVFLDFYKIRPFEWDDINEALADRYISYLESVGYMKYTLDKHISLFKTIVGVAERQGLHNNHFMYAYYSEGFWLGPNNFGSFFSTNFIKCFPEVAAALLTALQYVCAVLPQIEIVSNYGRPAGAAYQGRCGWGCFAMLQYGGVVS